MSDSADRDEQIFMEQLAGKVLGNLEPEEYVQLESVELDDDQRQILFDLEVTAAAVQTALDADETELPESLRSRILKQWAVLDSVGHQSSSESVESPPADSARRSDNAGMKASRPPAAGVTLREICAWIACAASILIALGLWNAGRDVAPMSVADARSQLQAQPGTLVAEWSAGPTPLDTKIAGDVVWNNERQQGYMRFVGMPVNDPSVEQYQLWIIDPGRDAEPVDGGVFDVSSSGEVVIPIDAKLRVVNPQTFAITIEQPGGVVVSTQEKLPLLASVN